MSIRTSAFSVANSRSASALTSSVLPTPVGPRNRNVPSGLSPSDRPTRARRTVSATISTASSWPMTRACRSVSRSWSRSSSPATSSPTGIPVRAAITAATSVSPTTGVSAPGGLGQALLDPLDVDLDLRRVLVGLGVDRGLLLGREPVALGLELRRVGRAAGAQAHLRGGLVDQVDRLVGQAVLGDVAVAQPRRGERAPRRRSSRRGAPRRRRAGRAGSRRSPRPTAPRPSRARSGGRARRRARSCGTRPAWWRRPSAARRGRASA